MKLKEIKNYKQTQTQQIFQTQPQLKLTSYDLYLKQVKNYSQNLTNKIELTFSHQNKAIKRKRLQLQKQLQSLRQKYFNERKKIRQMEEYFVLHCQNVIKTDINKWEENQNFFGNLFEHYQQEVHTQELINKKNKQKVQLLKNQLSRIMKQEIKELVSDRLQNKILQKNLNKSNFRSKKCLSVKSHSKMKTQMSQATKPTNRLPTDGNQSYKSYIKKSNTKRTQLDQAQETQRNGQKEKSMRIKTEMSLPTLKKQKNISTPRYTNDDFNFMKPIGTFKKTQKNTSILPELSKLFKQYFEILSNPKNTHIEHQWFQKVVFNKRNFIKIISHFDKEYEQIENQVRNKSPQTNKKAIQLVAKNLFRLKSEISVTKSHTNIKMKENREKSFMSTFQKSYLQSEKQIK